MQPASQAGERLGGIVPPLVTPLSERDQLDIAGLERLIEHLLSGGVHGLFILGTTGEAPSLSYELRRTMIRQACRLVDGRAAVLVGITDTAFSESVALAEVAHQAGAAAVVLATPYYFPAGQTELVGYIQRLCRRLPLPLILYNMPSLTKVWFEPETLQRLAAIDHIIGVKDSSGDLTYFERVVELKQQRPDWSVMVGPELLLGEALARGGDGGVAGGANVVPELFVRRYQAFVQGDHALGETLQRRIADLQRIYDIGKYASRHIKATKCALSLIGICDDFMAEPFNRFLPPERKRVAAVLSECFPELAIANPDGKADLDCWPRSRRLSF